MQPQTIIILSLFIIAALIIVSIIAYNIGREQGQSNFIQEQFDMAIAHGYKPPDDGRVNMLILFENPENDPLPPPASKHRLTHADLVQMETETRNKETHDNATLNRDA